MLFSLSFGLFQTYAALTDSDQKQNEFRVGNLQNTIEEEFDPPAVLEPEKDYLKKVAIKNTGEQESFIRVLALPILSKKQPNGSITLLPATVNGPVPVLSVDYNLKDWINGEDGYFYYRYKLTKGASTTNLFTNVKMNQANITEEYQGATLSFEVKAEGISTTKFAYRDAWWSGKIPTENPQLEVDNALKNQTVAE
ncbi:alternate signal-mediated exported protein [Enterococcus silesiacus]|nr:alternate signal-mediated exported protein [Enterococcus silesiacus]